MKREFDSKEISAKREEFLKPQTNQETDLAASQKTDDWVKKQPWSKKKESKMVTSDGLEYYKKLTGHEYKKEKGLAG